MVEAPDDLLGLGGLSNPSERSKGLHLHGVGVPHQEDHNDRDMHDYIITTSLLVHVEGVVRLLDASLLSKSCMPCFLLLFSKLLDCLDRYCHKQEKLDLSRLHFPNQ